MLIKLIKHSLLILSVLLPLGTYAEDIDIFVNSPAVTRGNPNVLFVLDNTANWSSTLPGASGEGKKFDAEVAALKTVIADLDDSFNVGLMMLSQPVQGGYMRFGVRPMTEANKKLFTKVLNDLVRNNDETAQNGGVYGAGLFEVYKYFGGGDGSGTQGKMYHGPEAHSGVRAGAANKLQDRRDYAGNPFIYGIPGVFAEPLDFYIETMGTFLDNVPTYTIMCDGIVVAEATVLPGMEQFENDMVCPGPDGAWSINVESTGYGDMVTWWLKDDNGATIFSGGPYGYGFSDTQVDSSGGLLAADGAALGSELETRYSSPITEGCGKNFVVLLSNGLPPKNTDDAAADLLANVGGDTSVIELPSPDATTNYADEFARFLYEVDVHPNPGKQNINTYTMAVYDEGNIKNSDVSNIQLMKSTANQGKGRYFAATSADEVAEALKKIFNEIQAVDSVFASVTLPVSVNVRGTHLNQVYMGVFRPDENDKPRWPGNLKHFKLKTDPDTDEVFLSDANGQKVHSDVTGFVVNDAESYWTESSNYWSFAPSGTPPSPSDLPDGPIVEKGGVAQQIRQAYALDQSSRKIYTQNMQPFTTDTLGTEAAVQAEFGATSADDLKELVAWIRGADNFADENNDLESTDIRASVHGDVLHSQPAVINYSADENDVVAFYGANDGLLRAVRVGDGANAGQELWAYIAEEFYSKFDRLRKNDEPRSDAYPKPYFFDGPITSLVHGGKTYIYVTARRGGDLVYAFDVTDPTVPKLLWKVNSGSSGMAELAQTWSAPSPAIIKAHGNPVVIMGGGYDVNQDGLFPGLDTRGRGIFVLDALNGDMLWQAGPQATGSDSQVVPEMEYSIPSDITAFDRNGDGYVNRGYVGDMGGNIWRIDMGDTFANWKVNKFASVGYAATPNNKELLKFFYAPDVAFAEDANGDYDAVLIGSGDRQKPFEERVNNRFFMFKDRATYSNFSASPIVLSDLYDASANLIQDGSDAQQEQAAADLLAARGAFFSLLPGEKVISKAVTIGGTSLFNTNQPESTANTDICESGLGIARLYQVNFENLSGATDDGERYVTSPGGGLPPSPTGIIFDDNGKIKEVVCVGTNCQEAPNTKMYDRLRSYWIELFN